MKKKQNNKDAEVMFYEFGRKIFESKGKPSKVMKELEDFKMKKGI